MNENIQIRVLIIDDEIDARFNVRKHLKRHSNDVEIIGECGNGYEAVDAISKYKPNLIFLDVEMPEINGFQVLEQIEINSRPLVIFVTAHNEYARLAYDVHAIDFLSKPLTSERFDEALVQARLWLKKVGDGLLLKPDLDYIQILAFKIGEVVYFIPTDTINWIKADEKYVEIYSDKNKAPYLRESISNLEKKLNPKKFVRIHRSHIVNIDFIKELRLKSKESFLVVLKNGIELPLSESGREKLRRLGIFW
jgi:two-component system LytT family response regulator